MAASGRLTNAYLVSKGFITLFFLGLLILFSANVWPADNLPGFNFDRDKLDVTNFDHGSTGFPLVGNHAVADCESCHIGGVFEGLPKKCVVCHDGSFAVGKDSNHIPTVENCDVCHTPVGFEASASTTFMDHSVVGGTPCSGCHDGVTAVGKGPWHIPTTMECDTCHSVNSWTIVSFDHSAVVGQPCIVCHDGNNATGKSANHILTTDKCDACHATSIWVPANKVDHREVIGTCTSCHNNLIAGGKASNHLSTTDDCAACHAIDMWIPVIRVDHSQVVGSCVSCHNGTLAIGKNQDHIASSNDCNTCHNVTAWIPVVQVDHDQVEGACEDCHNGIAASGKSDLHITTSNACDACHNSIAWLPITGVDHTQTIGTCESCHDGVKATGKGQDHILTTQACDSCHSTVNWLVTFYHSVVTGQACLDCHNGVSATGKNQNHINSTDLCESCHNTTIWIPVDPLVDHTQVTGACASCHDGVVATGQGAAHVPTTEACDACHTTTDWLVSLFDHSTVVGQACFECHDGVRASGKSTSHITSSDQCDACHIGTAAWIPVITANVDHAQVTGSCISCHDGVIASGKGVNHINTTDVCDACHQSGPTPWTPVAPNAVDHAEVIGVCSSCHDNVIATGKGANHIPTTDECDTCHNVQNWATGTVVDHTNFSGNCIACHDGVAASGKTAIHIASSDTCDACHQSFPATWVPVAAGAVDHNNVIGTCISCHDAIVASGKGADHINATDQCDACHAVGPTPWVPVAASAVDHTQVIGSCISCHDGVIASGKGAAHINSSDQCDACHALGPTPWTPVVSSAVNHSQVVGTCISCHDGIVASGKSTIHINTSDNCEACHQPAPTPWIPLPNSAVDHNEVIGVCSTCHDNVVASGKHAAHIVTTQECDACHLVSAWVPAVVDHALFVNNCLSCHDGVTASGKGPTHIDSSDVCDACHEKAPATWIPVTPAAVDHTQVNGSCISCHDTVTASGKGPNHIATSDQCDTCHATGPTPWVPVAPAAVDHSQVLGTCISCHDGSTASGKGPNHINTTDTCEACHGVPPQAWVPLPPSATDHAEVIGTCESCHDGVIARGKGPVHVTTTEACEVCHATSTWLVSFDHASVAGQACISCHDGLQATGKNPSHISTTDLCEACHITNAWLPVAPAAVDHNEVIGVCSSCHDNVIATGKGATHIPTVEECDSCHQVTAWIPAAVDHTPFIDNCMSCHDGVAASGKGPTHFNTTDLCETCHEKFPATWVPVTPAAVDHAQVLGTCFSCHDGALASGKSPAHINSSDACDACHVPGPTPWVPVSSNSVDHTQVVGTCISCHDGVIASGKGPNHINSTDACDACHAVAPTPWLPVAPAAVDHTQVIGSCISCHDGTIASGKSVNHINTSDQCDACHAVAPTPWTPVAPAAVDHTQVVGSCVSCHDGVVASGKGPIHINTSDVCEACHQPAPTPWTPIPNNAVDHNEVIGVCSTCHNGVIASGKSPTHIVTTQECDNCHSTTVWTPAAVDHVPFVNNCITCHDGVTASGKGPAHINTSDVCDTCHEKFPATWVPVVSTAVDHTQVIGNCVSCHDGVIASGKGPNHIDSSDQCDACHVPGPTPWLPVAAAGVDHTQVIGTCISCHDGVIASGKGPNHINSSDQCDACHAPGPIPWIPVAPAAVDHTQVVGTCFSCHDGTTANGKSPSHINTSDLCEACHQPAPTPWVPLANSAVDHNEVIGVCSTCHDNIVATGKGATHIVTTQECDACHATSAWTPAVVDHTLFLNNCVSCHDGVTASGKGPTHINSTDACELCHEKSPATWVPVTPAAVDHTQVIGTCISCHDGVIASGKGPNHINSSDQCDACHAPGPTPWVPVVSASVDHTQVVGSCISCHDGTIASGKGPNHINSTDACDACHGVPPQAWTPLAPSATDHTQVIGTCESCHDGLIARGKGPTHVTTVEACDVCHVATSWLVTFDHTTVTGQACFSCHDGILATGKNATHINTTDLCEACHVSTAWIPVAPSAVDHNEVIGVCSSCHDNVVATGKGPAHVPTVEECDTCHQNTAWVPASIDHAPFVNNCLSCHDGVIASGKSATHIASSDACELCHEKFPATWVPVAPNAVDHSQVLGTCTSCHNGTVASGKGPTHINSTDQCDACHGVPPETWTPLAPGVVDHAHVIGSCASCHDGTIASGKGPTHISTSDVCDACHQAGPVPWVPVAVASVDHTQVIGTCVSCHDGIVASGKGPNHIQSSEQCDACHAPGPAAWASVQPAAVDHTQLTGPCISCHDGVTASGKSAIHINTTDQCDACHNAGLTPWIPVAPSAVDHSQVIGTCSSCHNNVTASGKPPTHIVTTQQCDNCHTSTAWVPASVDHINFVNNCTICHDGITASGMSAAHIPTTNFCDACHEKFPATWVPVAASAVDHSQVIGTCTDCHNGVVASGKSATHINSTNNCDACHGVPPEAWSPLIPSAVDHTQVIGTCASCHDGLIASGKSATHINSSVVCDACHLPGPTPWQPLAPSAVDHTQVIGTCASCHNGIVASGKSVSHINSSDQCDTCHLPGPIPWLPVAAGAVDHTQVTGTCVSCHDGTVASGKSVSHINSTNTCDACHQPGPIPWTPLANSAVDHNEVIGVCSSCHNNVIATGKSATHIVTTQQCDNCHTSTAWVPANVDHTNFFNNCTICHDGVTASGKSAAHIPATDFCDACHEKFPATWVPVSPGAVDHTQVIGACFDCHNGTVASGKSPIHITSSNQCDACHGVPPESWTSLAPSAVDHTQVTGICSSCHNGTVASGKSATHINSTNTCDACHQAGPVPWTPVTSGAVDHTHVIGTCASCHNGVIASGKSVNHISTTDTCDACHLPGPTPWTPVAANAVDHNQVLGTCASCHNGIDASGKGPAHISTTEACDTCHLPGPTPWLPVANSAVDHNEVLGVCSSCHDNTIATGKGPAHIPTTLECNSCHAVTAWVPVTTVDHSTFTANCISCHDGVTASGKTAAHLLTSNVCEACHQVFPASWVPVAVSAVDHTQVQGICSSCHNGTLASGKSAVHINTSNTCDACHQPGPTPWTPVQTSAVDHGHVIGTCASCHNGTIASGKGPAHIQTSDVCDACHLSGPTPWVPVASNAVDHTQVIGTCFSCHNGTTASGKSPAHISTTNVCEACHQAAPTPWSPVATSAVDHTQVIGTCISCHNGTTASGKSAVHMSTTDFCDACHLPGPTPWIPVASTAVDHNQVLGTCFSCHNGTTASGKSPSHISTTNICEACHQAAPTPWVPLANSAVDHAQVIGVCSSCHNNTIATGKGPAHIQTTLECDSCHAVTAWVPVTTVDHSTFTTNCISCHDGVTASGKTAVHVPTSNVCEACHAVSPANWVPVASNAVDHNQVQGICSSCHNGILASGKSANHINSTNTCDACHQPGPTPWTPIASSAVDHTHVIGTCASCHNGIVASGKSPSHINTSDTCDACHLPGPTPWSPVAANAVDHTQVLGTCVSCHNGIQASGKSPSHITTTNLCEACHQAAPVPWVTVASSAVDHNEVLGTCASCHNGTTASGKSVNHINSTNTCDACHLPGPTPWTPVASSSVDHNQVIGTCVSCHNGTIAGGKSPSHINTTNVCDACHLPGPTPWTPVAPGAVDHNEVIGVCSSCHNNTIATGKGGGHIPTTLECDSCHSVNAWTPVTVVDHSTFVGNCITCHDGVTASGKNANHLNSTNQCDACHQKFPANWAPVASSAVDHTQVLGICSSCHNGIVASGKSGNHINSTNTCDACHQPGPVPWSPLSANAVDHGHVIGTCVSCHNNTIASGKPGNHPNTTDLCEACHNTAPNTWLPFISPLDHSQVLGTCVSCHNGTIAQGKPGNHPNTTNNCDACHMVPPNTWLPFITPLDHNEVIGTCVSCHNGSIAQGKPGNHPSTSDVCEACHRVPPNNWLPFITPLDHNQVVGTCVSCHNGGIAQGKPGNHPNTTDNCDVCHRVPPNNWLPFITPLDHNEVIGTCVSCHDGGIATGKPGNHPSTSNVCEACHRVPPNNWLPFITPLDHNQVVGTCVSCHNGGIAQGKPGNHPNTTDNCDACHQVPPNTWLPFITPLDHNEVIGTCVSCHNGTIAQGKPGNHPSTTDLCEACHRVPPSNWLPFITPLDHNQVVGTCVSCHNGGIAQGKPGNHPNTTDNCDACHMVPPNNWLPFITPLDHNEVLGTCVSCHNGTIAQGKPGNHPSTSDVCEACHRVPPSNWLPFITPLDHNQVVGTCVSCHNGGIAQGKPGNHPNTTDNCDACHMVPPNNWLPFITPLDHNEVLGTCVSCHNGTIAQGKPGNHPSTTDLCEACHRVPPNTWLPFITPLDHNQVLGSCVSCHNGGIATGKPGNHPSTTDVCDACHRVAPNTWLPFITPLDHNEVLGTCVSCHNNVIATGKPANHPSTTDICEACHRVPPNSWLPFITPLDHNQVLGSCVSCHNNVVATGKPGDHPSTSDVCDACHRVPPDTWLPFISPLDHNQVLGSCVSCHDGGIATGKPGNHPSTTDNCDACHGVPPNTWLPFITPLDHNEVLGTCVSCHDGTIATGKPGNHPPTSNICEACHNVPPANWLPFISPLDHNEVTGACVVCHDGGIATGKPGNHPNTSDSCENCHGVPPATWLPVLTPFSHGDAFDTCSTCHDGGIALGKPGDHCPTTEDCDVCHTTTSFLPAFGNCNEPPVASASATPNPAGVSQVVTFDGSGSFDPDGDTLTYDWDFGDGAIGSGVTTSHTYTNPGSYSASLTVTDTVGGSTDTANITVDVTVQAPTANPGGPYAGIGPAAGVTLTLDGTGSSDPNSPPLPLTYQWDFGDGSTGTGPTPSHTFTQACIHTVMLTVNNGIVDSTSVTTTADISFMGGGMMGGTPLPCP